MAAFRNERKPYSRPAGRPRVSEGTWVHDKALGFKNADSAPRKISTPAVSEGTTKLMVSNLHYELTPRDLSSIFGQYGTLVREPLIRYDRSGRSSGVAIVFYETATEAAEAKREFDGKLAKGQAMKIEFDDRPPARPRRVTSAPSLMTRIQKPPLLDRLGDSSKPYRAAPSAPRGPGPVRTKARPVKEKKQPKTAQDLDSELDAFMKDDNVPTASAGDVEMAA